MQVYRLGLLRVLRGLRVSGVLKVAVLVLSAFLAGCGQKGPLYREAPGPSPAAAEATPTDDSEREDDQY